VVSSLTMIQENIAE